MKAVAILLVSGCTWAQSSLTLAPAVMTQCTAGGLSRTRAFWNAAGSDLVHVRIGGPDGPSFTGLTQAQGSDETGDWVSDGMVFSLTSAGGQELARATARVACTTAPDPIVTALSASSYFPLDVGDEWVYRIDNRIGTGAFQVRRVERAEFMNGTLWFIISFKMVGSPPLSLPVETPYRTDTQGRVYWLDLLGIQHLMLDPTGSNSGLLHVLTKGSPARTSLGNFPDTLTYDWFNVLTDERGSYARGIGFISSSSTMLTGSSGGFLQSYALVYARIAGNLVFNATSATLELGVESRDLDLTTVTNCAVPCYFVACGLTPGADPPGTFKPCFRATVRVQDSPAAFVASPQQKRRVQLDLLDAADGIVFSAIDDVQTGIEQAEAILVRSILMSARPGAYRVRATLLSANGAETDSATIAVQVH